MKSLSNTYLNSLSSDLVNKVSKVRYKLDSVITNNTDIIKQSSGSESRIYVNFNSDIEGSISDVQLLDQSDQIIASHDQEYIKSLGSPLIIAFIYEFVEVEGGKFDV